MGSSNCTNPQNKIIGLALGLTGISSLYCADDAYNSSDEMRTVVAGNLSLLQNGIDANSTIFANRIIAVNESLPVLNGSKANVGGGNCTAGNVVKGFTVNNNTAPSVYCVADATSAGGVDLNVSYHNLLMLPKP